MVASASNPIDPLPEETIQETLLLTASGTQQDHQNLEELVNLYRQTDRGYSDREEVFLPAFLSHSRSDLLQVLVDDRQGVLDVLQFGEYPWGFVFEILSKKPLPEATPAVARLLLADLNRDDFRTSGMWKHYFSFVIENDPRLEPLLLTRVVRESHDRSLTVFAIQRLAELVDHDPKDVVAERISREFISPLRIRNPQRLHDSARNIIAAALKALDHWQSKAGIDLVVEEMQAYDSHPYATDLLLQRVSMPVICGDEVKAKPFEANRAFSKWWKTHHDEVAWDSASQRWIADKRWLHCGQAMEEGRVFWDENSKRYYMHRSPALATAGQWIRDTKKYYPLIVLFILLPISLISQTFRNRKEQRNSSEHRRNRHHHLP